MTRSVRQKYCLLIFITLCVITFYHVTNYLLRPRLENLVFYSGPDDLGSRDPEVTCLFPLPHPLDPSILSYVEPANKVKCYGRNYILTYIDEEGILKLNKSGFKEAGYGISDLACYYSSIIRDDDFKTSMGPWIPLLEPTKPDVDFIMVKCYGLANMLVYSNYHASVQRQPSVRKFQDDMEMSLAVIGLDSMSRLNFMRQMPKSYRLIKNFLNATIMLGFNKVGENTFPNVIPMLTGSPPHWSPYHQFKGWPLIWNEWEDAGAATMYTEDKPLLTMFEYMAEGIEPQPTHHYMRTFWVAVEESLLRRRSSSFCLGTVPNHVIYFNYLKSFFRVYQDSPSFMFSLFNEATHDYVNLAGLLDDDMVQFLNSSYHEGLLNRTVVLVLGDHGNRIDKIRETKIGQIEDKMPLVAFILPPWVDKVRPQWRRNLEINARRLTASFDLYSTFRQVLDTLVNGKTVKPREPVDKHFLKNKKEGVGLLGSVVRSGRECDEAGVPESFCVCPPEREESLTTADSRSTSAVALIIRHINEELLNGLFHLCSPLTLDQIEQAVLRTTVAGKRTLRITIRTSPNDGLFEGYVKLDPPSVASLVRINRYGTQSACLPENVLKGRRSVRGFCFCL